MSDIVHKHYKIPSDLDKILYSYSNEKNMTQSDTIAHLTKLGLKYETIINKEIDVKLKIDKIERDVRFIKKLLIQLFVNKSFTSNREISMDNAYKEFLDINYSDKVKSFD